MNDGPVLVVGGTGMLGSQVATALLARGKQVRALVRPGSDASRLEAAGVDIGRGDMIAWFQSGRYVADTTRQREVFGAPPTAEDAIRRLVGLLGHQVRA